MADYATIQEVKLYAYQDTSDDDQLLTSLIPKASRIFDKLCGVEPNHFAAEEAVATPRVFYGTGTDFLEIGAHKASSITTVTMPSGYTVPDYVVKDDFLVRTYNDNGTLRTDRGSYGWWDWWNGWTGSGWYAGVPVTITAKWGQDTAIPEDVKEATIELTLAMWRSRDTAFLRVVQLDNQQILNDAVPPRVKAIADEYRKVRQAYVFA